MKIHVCHYCARVIFLCINCAYIINPFLIDVHQFLVKTIAYTTTPNCLSEIKSLLLLKHLECDMILSVTCRTLVTKHQIWLVWQIARFKLKTLPPDMLIMRNFVHKTFWVWYHIICVIWNTGYKIQNMNLMKDCTFYVWLVSILMAQNRFHLNLKYYIVSIMFLKCVFLNG